MGEPVLEMRGIVKSFGSKLANDHIDLSIMPGEIHALLGENGAGKSTLMNVLLGIYKPNSGDIYYKGKLVNIRSPRHAVDLGIGMVHQHFHLIPTLTAAENIFLYSSSCPVFLDRKKMEEKIAECSSEFHLDIDPSAKIWQMSVGEQQRVEIIKLLYRGADILILDEPSAILTAREAADMFKILRKMADSGKSVVVISHKINEVMQFADRITVLRSGRVEDTMVAADATVERLTKAIVGNRTLVQQKNTGSSAGEELVLELKNISAKNDRNVEILKNISFKIHRGEIFGIAGVAGNGQRELCEVVAGLRKSESGSVILGGEDISSLNAKQRIDKKIAFIPEDRRSMGLVMEMNMDDNRILKEYRTEKFSRRGFIRHKAVSEQVDAEIRQHDIKIVGKDTPVSFMSGGNQQKLIVAREIGGDPAVIIAAYPSRGLDMGAAETVRDILLDQCRKGVAVLLVSEELDELFQMSDRIGVLCSGEMLAVMDRDKADYETLGRLMSGERLEV
ncbi:MAG: ABC transporter ATP-binding protein [Lachnospiraceae bacterium]|nr:ABC transporter ATP-binding protein [Lachnospiraceae bacterium]